MQEAPTGRTKPIELDVVSDTVCPWCFIGKRRLDQALAAHAAAQGAPGWAPVSVTWRPYQLDPDVPPDGLEREAHLARKFGDAEKVRQIGAQIREIGAAAGLDFAFDRIAKSPNTLASHCLIRWAGSAGVQEAMVERLFTLYFQEGADIGDPDVLTAAADDLGMDADLVASLLSEGRDREAVAREALMAQQMGIQGVPAFVFDGKFALVGAQEPETLLKAFNKAARETAGPT